MKTGSTRAGKVERIAKVGTSALLMLGLATSGAWATHHETPSDAGLKPWDQERMTELSSQLAKEMKAVRNAFRNDPIANEPVSPHRRAAQQMSDTLRHLHRTASQLHTRVKGGGDYEQTLGIARKIGTLLNDADELGRRIMSSTWTNERVKPAMETLNQIAPYYGSDPLYDPENLQRVDRAPASN